MGISEGEGGLMEMGEWLLMMKPWFKFATPCNLSVTGINIISTSSNTYDDSDL